jgi:transmembrane sensor
MSGHSHDDLPLVDAKALRERAGDWLERHDRPEWNAEDQAALDAWLAESPAHLVAYWRVEGAWQRAQRLRAVRPTDSVPSNDGSLKRSRPVLRGVVAAFGAVIVAAAAAMLFAAKPHDQVISTPVGGREIVSLKDGSRVELNTDTILRIDVAPDHRLASIEKGEAYFQIAHDAKHPFVVAARDRRITVLGTRFIVRQTPDHLEVALLDGRVWVDGNAGQPDAHGMLLMPGDEVIATSNSLSRVKKSTQDIRNELSWRSGMLIFRNDTLADAAAELNRYNAKKLIVADSATARLKIIGEFPTNDVTMFVRASRQLFNLRVENRGSEIILSR